MKIRSYKGTSREKICEIIRREMGPTAVIVSSQETTEMKGFMPRRIHELIAVADDASADGHLLERAAGAEEVRKLSRRQDEYWKALEQRFDRLQHELRDVSQGVGPSGPGVADAVPGFAREWDPRFLGRARTQVPELFTADADAGAAQRLEGLLNVCEQFPVRRERQPHVVVLVGPTGSGKTTTVAKLAASWCLGQKLKVGIITTDTFRIAAVDQAREYAALLGVEMRIAFSAAETRRAVESFAGKDVVLVDTPGRNHYDQIGMSSLLGSLESMGAVSVLMLVPATLDRRFVPDVIGSFQKLRPDYLVLTKIDEARDLAIATTLACEAPWPIAFLTDGQRVPQDLCSARRRDIVARLLGARNVPGEASGLSLSADSPDVPGPAREMVSPPVLRRPEATSTPNVKCAA